MIGLDNLAAKIFRFLPGSRRKSLFRALIIAIIALNISSYASASGEKNNYLQWFPSLTAENGTVYIVWADERNGNYTMIMNDQPHRAGDIYFSKGSRQNGWIFEKNIRINEIEGTAGHGSPSIGIDSNNIYVVWEDDRYGSEELFFSTAQKTEMKFKKDSHVVDDPGSQALPSISILNGSVYAAMMNKKTWDIEFTEAHPANGIYRFDEPVRVNNDPPGNWHYGPSLAVDDENNVCIAWLDARNTNYDIYFSHGIKENSAWRFEKNIRLNDDPENASHYTPSIAFDNGSAYVAWYDDRNNDFDIYLTTGRIENNSWKFEKNTRVNDDTGRGDQMHPEIAASDGKIFLVWEDGRSGGSDIYFSTLNKTNEILKIGKNIKVNGIQGKHFDPQIAIAGSDVYIAWQAETNTSDSGDIYFSDGRYNGNVWEFSRDIKINDDVNNSFSKPETLFLSMVLVPVMLLIIIAGFLKKYGKRKNWP